METIERSMEVGVKVYYEPMLEKFSLKLPLKILGGLLRELENFGYIVLKGINLNID